MTRGEEVKKIKSSSEQMARVDEEGVTFKSFIDGSKHRFTQKYLCRSNMHSEQIFSLPLMSVHHRSRLMSTKLVLQNVPTDGQRGVSMTQKTWV
jgi:hypothetical protein